MKIKTLLNIAICTAFLAATPISIDAHSSLLRVNTATADGDSDGGGGSAGGRDNSANQKWRNRNREKESDNAQHNNQGWGQDLGKNWEKNSGQGQSMYDCAISQSCGSYKRNKLNNSNNNVNEIGRPKRNKFFRSGSGGDDD